MVNIITNFFWNFDNKISIIISGFRILEFGILGFRILDLGYWHLGYWEFGILGIRDIRIQEIGIRDIGNSGNGLIREIGIWEIDFGKRYIRENGIQEIVL